MKAPLSPGDESLLMVANYSPDVGYAWWLMENFWEKAASVARSLGLTPLLAYPVPGPIPSSVLGAGVEVLVCPTPGKGFREVIRSLQLIRKRRVRVMYLTDRRFSHWFYALARLAGVRAIICHDHTPGDRPPVGGSQGFGKAMLHRGKLWSCDLQICVSPLIRQRAIENVRIPPAKAVVVQNGVQIPECSGNRMYARRVFGLGPEKCICVTVGRAHPYKRIDFVIEVARRCVLDRARRDMVFLYCGDGPDMERLRRLARDSNLDDHFIFAGKREDVAEILCSSDIALHAARGEAFSLAILEYMSAGLPVLVPDIPSVSQAIRHGETGLLYVSGDVDSAAGLLIELSAQPSRRLALGRRARAEVQDRFSFAKMNEEFARVLREVMNARDAPPGPC